MPKYLIAYHRGKEYENPEEGAKQKKKWQAWISEFGDSVVNPGTPLTKSKIINSSGVFDCDESCLTGYSIIIADSIDVALEFAKRCPYLDIGTVEVAEVIEM